GAMERADQELPGEDEFASGPGILSNSDFDEEDEPTPEELAWLRHPPHPRAQKPHAHKGKSKRNRSDSSDASSQASGQSDSSDAGSQASSQSESGGERCRKGRDKAKGRNSKKGEDGDDESDEDVGKGGRIAQDRKKAASRMEAEVEVEPEGETGQEHKGKRGECQGEGIRDGMDVDCVEADEPGLCVAKGLGASSVRGTGTTQESTEKGEGSDGLEEGSDEEELRWVSSKAKGKAKGGKGGKAKGKK
ncbi:hypothetical protein FRC06_008759, partial [Ceratobasidium sp. 370]